jgi:hypothetical protein
MKNIKNYKSFEKKNNVELPEKETFEIDLSKNKDQNIDDSEYIRTEMENTLSLDSVEIEYITDISLEKPTDLKENIIINADLGGNEVKRNDVLYITAMVKKKNVNWNSMAVLKVRVTDIYQGLSILNTLI